MDTWFASHVLEPYKYRVDSVLSRQKKPFYDRQLIVGGVFVHVFNDVKSCRGMAADAFLASLVQHLKASFKVRVGCGVTLGETL